MWRNENNGKDRAAALAALAGIAGLVLCALVVSPEPPEDLLAPRILPFLRGLAPGVSGTAVFILSFGAGMGAFLLVLGLVLKVLDRKARERGKEPRYRRPERGVIAGIVILVVTFILVPRLSIEAFRTAMPGSAGDAAESAAPPTPAYSLPEEQGRVAGTDGKIPRISPLFALAAALAGALVLGGGLAVILSRRDGGRTEGVHTDLLAALAAAEAAGRARRRIELGDPVRDAVVECYGAMCAIFEERAGADGRDVGALTAREFATRLALLGAAEPEILELTSVFEKARYSAEECGEADRARAIRALSAIEARYATPDPDRAAPRGPVAAPGREEGAGGTA